MFSPLVEVGLHCKVRIGRCKCINSGVRRTPVSEKVKADVTWAAPIVPHIPDAREGRRLFDASGRRL